MIPASELTVLFFALDYFLNEGARGAAYSKAYGEAQTTIVSLLASVSEAKAIASSSTLEANDSKEVVDSLRIQVEKILEDALEYYRKLKTVVAAEQQLADKVAESLLKDDEFIVSSSNGT